MTRQSSSFQDWEKARRAEERARQQAERKKDQERKASERERAQAEAAARENDAVTKTQTIERRVEELDTLLRSSLTRDPRIDPLTLRRHADVSPLDLGELAIPLPAPQWADFAPKPPGVLSSMLGGRRRYELDVHDAEGMFARAQEEHRQHEIQRQHKVVDKKKAHERRITAVQRSVSEHNANIDTMVSGLEDGERHAVSAYMELVLRRSAYPSGFPDQRRTGYVPESSLLAVEWYLPTVDVVPEYKSFRHIKTRKAVEPVDRPLPEIRKVYQRIIAQIALRTLREVFDADPSGVISTVVFNGRVNAVNPATGQKIEPHLITLRATREQFAPLVLGEPRFDPVACVRRHFFADVSAHPDEMVPVEPVMRYSMADPRAVDPVDVISDIDKRPNLIDMEPKKFEAFVQNLFAKMGFDTQLFQATGDGGVDCVAYDPHPITGGKFIIQAKLYTHTVQPTHVRDLWGTVQHEGATKGIMITTSGYGPDSYKFASGKPLNLIDGTGLLALCHEHDIPARILHRNKKKKRP